MQRTRSIRLLLPNRQVACTAVLFSPLSPVSAVLESSAQLQSMVRSRIMTLSVEDSGCDAKQTKVLCSPATRPAIWIVVEYIPSPDITQPERTSQAWLA